ncbi:MAG: hypothetical protein IPJ81_07520 [Chitinophagaceae bacterium]|nr:hypothetical protein [Chitinophagaceae bacterium]
MVNKLSSEYLKQTNKDDCFEYVSVDKQTKNTYNFIISTSSGVDFISMPFAIRIMRDATIISVLHSRGFNQKHFSVWGQKINNELF